MKKCVTSSADWGTAGTGPRVSRRREDPTLPFLPSVVEVISCGVTRPGSDKRPWRGNLASMAAEGVQSPPLCCKATAEAMLSLG